MNLRIRSASNLLVAFLMAALCLPAFTLRSASPASSAPLPLPEKYDGSMMIYDFEACDPVPQWPDSLRPVYVGYVARHGARFLSSAKKVSRLQKALYEASTSGKITPEGKEFIDLIDRVTDVTDNHWGALSPVGVEEEIRLAGTLTKIFPEIGNSNVRLSTVSTFVPRAVMTMYEFNHRLVELNRRVEITAAEGAQFSPLLYCFEADSAYRVFRSNEGPWKALYDKCVAEIVPTGPARRLLGEFASNDKKRLRDLTMDIYDIIQSNRAAGIPQPTTRWMTEEEYRLCWIADNYVHYLRNTVNPLSSVAGQATSTLVKELCRNAERALADTLGKGVKFDGYFGHAETLMPLLSALRIPGCHAMSLDWNEVARVWKVEEVVPLAANFMVILLRGESGKIYARVRLNGRDVAPIPGEGLLIGWNELSSFWLSTLKEY